MSSATACPCGGFVHPATITNLPGLGTIRYRIGEFPQFREALLAPLAAETALTLWRPGAEDDLAVQIVEWWAYLADVLTFYNERIANQHYLRTADLDESVRHIVRLLGYRPQPGIGAVGRVAALIKGPKSITVPAGFQIQSKPGAGQTPQTFEVDQAATASVPDTIPADPSPSSSVSNSVLLRGIDARLTVGETLLMVNKGYAAASSDLAVFVIVASAAVEMDPRGNRNTRVGFTSSISPGAYNANTLRLLRSAASIALWGYNGTFLTDSEVHLASLARDIPVGDIAVFDKGGDSPSTRAVSVTSNSEQVWFAYSDDPTVSPDPSTTVPIPILHTILGFRGSIDVSDLTNHRAVTRVRYGYVDVGTIIPTPGTTLYGTSFTLAPAPGSQFPYLESDTVVLVEDGNGDGTLATVISGSPTELSLTVEDPVSLTAPFNVRFNVLGVSRGKTVTDEVLGSGDATQTGQEFTLKKSPLTYLLNTDPAKPGIYRSTLRLTVDDIEWKEVASFYGQSASARVFVTREDDENNTHVMFGDGVLGSRLPSGTNNVKASYRYESGAALPDTGKLTAVLKAIEGLKTIVNPVQPFGGADPDPAGKLRMLAPKSVVTFGRAVSGSDYEAIAAATPGVARAKAYWSFDSVRQQTLVTVYVGDNAGAATAARKALRRAADPNRPLSVLEATDVPIGLALTVRLKAGYQVEVVKPLLYAALLDDDVGFFGKNVTRIGQTVFRSQIYAVCLNVEGTDWVRNFELWPRGATFGFPDDYRFYAGEGDYFRLDPADLHLNVEAAPNA
jgi:hypothetical protein